MEMTSDMVKLEETLKTATDISEIDYDMMATIQLATTVDLMTTSMLRAVVLLTCKDKLEVPNRNTFDFN